MAMRVGDIVYIEWEDHCTDMPSWSKSDQWHHSVCSVKTVGFVILNGKKYLTLVQMLQNDNSVASQSITIVKSCITKLKRLSVK